MRVPDRRYLKHGKCTSNDNGGGGDDDGDTQQVQSLLRTWHCFKRFTHVNWFNLHTNPIRYVLFFYYSHFSN